MLLRTENGGVNTPASAFVLILTTVYAFPPVVSKRVVLLSFLSSFFFQPPPSAPAMVRDSSKLLQAAAVTILNPRFVAERYPPCRATPMDATGHETASAGPQSGGRVVSSATQTATNAGGGDVAGFLFDDEEDDDEGSVGHLGTRGGVVVGASPGAASMDSPLVRGMGQGGAGGVTTRDKSQTIANNFLLRLQRQRQEKQRPQNTNAAVACLFGDDGDVWEETVEGEFEENYGDGSKRPTTPTDANPSAQQHPKEPSSHKPGTARPQPCSAARRTHRGVGVRRCSIPRCRTRATTKMNHPLPPRLCWGLGGRRAAPPEEEARGVRPTTVVTRRGSTTFHGVSLGCPCSC